MSEKKFTKDDIATAGALGVMQWFANKRADDPRFKEKEAVAAMMIQFLFLDGKKLEDVMDVQEIAGEAAVSVLDAIDLMDAMDDDESEKSVKADQEAEDAEDDVARKEIAFEVTTTPTGNDTEKIGVRPKTNMEISKNEWIGVITSLLVHIAAAGVDEADLIEEMVSLTKDAFSRVGELNEKEMAA